MNFFRNLFRQEKKPVEYEESKPQHTDIDIQRLKKEEIKPFLIENLHPDYWKEDSSVSTEELNKISSVSEINERIQSLDQCLNATNQGLFLDVMENYDTFLTGLENIQNINILLEQSKVLANESKNDIQLMQNELKIRYLRIIYLRKRQIRLQGLIKELKNFEDICYAVSLSIKQAIKQGNLYEALELCNEASINLKNFEVEKYKALAHVVEIAEKRKGKVYVKMKASLRELCHKFDSHLYENVLLSYMTIASYDDINNAIQAEFMHSISRLIKESIEEAVPNLPASSIEYMIKITPSSYYVPCIRLMYKHLTSLMYNHHLLSRWHEENEYFLHSFAEKTTYPITHKFIKNPEKLKEIKKFYVEVKMNLLKNRKFIWEKIQQNLAKIISESEQINFFTLSEIRVFLSWTDTFIEIGEDFSGLACQDLRSSLTLKSKSFFRNFHLMNLSQLVSILEAEQWTRLPIPRDFEIHSELYKDLSKLRVLSALIESFNEYNFSFSKLVQGNPFDVESQHLIEAEEDPQKYLFGGLRMVENSPVLCTTGMNLIKSASKYLELTKVLTPISFEVFQCLGQLLELFIYEVFRIFSLDSSKFQLNIELTDKEVSGEQLESYYDTFLYQSKFYNIKTNIGRIAESLEALPGDCGLAFKHLHKQISPQPTLPKALIALQTCKHLITSLDSVKEYTKTAIASIHDDYIQSFLSRSQNIIKELEEFIIVPILTKSLNLDWLSSSIISLKWDEKKEENSGFVNRLIHILDDFKDKLEAIGGGSIPESIQLKVLGKAARICNEQIIENFCKVKRCNQLGREQMRRDFRNFNSAIKNFIGIERPQSQEEYLDIWGSTPETIYEWILANIQFGLKMQKSLFLTAPSVMSMNKSTRNSMLNNIENFYRQRIFR